MHLFLYIILFAYRTVLDTVLHFHVTDITDPPPLPEQTLRGGRGEAMKKGHI